MQPTQPAIAVSREKVIRWRSGEADYGEDAFFTDANNELTDKGFLVAAADDLIAWARKGSLMWMQFGLACCAIEMMQVAMPRFDVERFGFAPRSSPRPMRRDDHRRDAHQQDGASAAQGLRPDAGAALRDLHGIVRQRRRLLPLFLLGGARL